MTVYAWPRFSRGHGFGGRLFPWARARVFAAVNGARFIDPVWTRPALGPLLRGGIALRYYREQILLSGLFRRLKGDQSTLRGLWASRRAVRLPEPADPRAPWLPPEGLGDVRVEFLLCGDYFEPLVGWSGRLLADLEGITRTNYRMLVQRLGSVPIAINVRCGHDFPRPAPGVVRLQFGQATPVSWFVQSLRLLRSVVRGTPRAFVVSDGTREQLRELLAEPETVLVRPGCAISDLLVLSRARVLLASGSSGFSAWGAFLGGMPAASHPGQPLTEWRMPSRDGGAVRVELDPAAPDPGFLAAVARALVDGEVDRSSQ